MMNSISHSNILGLTISSDKCHAKSSWNHPDLTDHDRPPNKRGKGDAQCMGRLLKKDNLIPIKYYDMFRQKLPKAKYEMIADAGHAPFVEKTALLHEKLHTFLMQEDRPS